ncbi:MAG TPA: hypothetical protein VFA61_06340, partial [Candidatus Udaeobacter sp.]|nr:hypothetical protein [Candidatus Udaeobacter sp.]
MRTNFCWQSLALAALIFAGSAFSKRESETSPNTTVTPTATASPPPAATASASPVMGTPTASPFADI